MPTKKKNIFIACSTSAKPLAKALKKELCTALANAQKNAIDPLEAAKYDAEIREWYNTSVAVPGSYILGMLAEERRLCDFAIVLLTKDDFGQKKGESLDLPRDNTIFELGLFTGELGTKRCLMVCTAEESALPSDLKGIIRVDIPKFYDLGSDDGLAGAAEFAVGRTLEVIKANTCFSHPRLPIITKAELAELEKPAPEGNLEIVSSDTAVVVNSVQPVELKDPIFCRSVLRNLKVRAQYEYYYGEFSKNLNRTANLVFNLATAGLNLVDGGMTKDDLDTISKNLAVMQRNLSIHFRRRPPLQFCIHNAESVENAVCYLRCHGDYRNDFVQWATGDDAIEIAEELRNSCKELVKERAIFHSTIDCNLDKTAIVDAIKDLFPEDLPAEFYRELSQRCVGE